MWEIKLDDDLWLAKDLEATTKESEAWLLPDMPSVQAQLKKVRRYMQYPNAIVVAEFNQTQPISE